MRSLGTCDALLTFSHHLKVALDRGREERLFQLDFSATFDRVSQHGLLHKLRSTDVAGQLLSIVSEFIKDTRQRVLLNGRITASVMIS